MGDILKSIDGVSVHSNCTSGCSCSNCYCPCSCGWVSNYNSCCGGYSWNYYNTCWNSACTNSGYNSCTATGEGNCGGSGTGGNTSGGTGGGTGGGSRSLFGAFGPIFDAMDDSTCCYGPWDIYIKKDYWELVHTMYCLSDLEGYFDGGPGTLLKKYKWTVVLAGKPITWDAENDLNTPECWFESNYVSGELQSVCNCGKSCNKDTCNNK